MKCRDGRRDRGWRGGDGKVHLALKDNEFHSTQHLMCISPYLPSTPFFLVSLKDTTHLVLFIECNL